jgi:pimeloyl-ACP methyl ester carboxylesterase
MRTKLTFVPGISAILLVAVLSGCADDGSKGNGGEAAPPDAAEIPPHVSNTTLDANVPMFDKTRKTREFSTGITVSYVEAGNAGGDVVIMLHGWTDTNRSFYPLIERLVADNTQFHIYALDQRGHGAASMPRAAECAAAPEECFEMTDFRDDVLAFMDAGNIESAHIVGHSLGSLVGQELALSDPDRVESLVLIGTTVSGAGNAVLRFLRDELIEGQEASTGHWRGLLKDATPDFQWPEDAYELTPADADPHVGDFMENVWVTEFTADPAFLADIVPETTNTKIGTWVGALRSLMAFSSEGRLRQLTVPTLVIWATQDVAFINDPDQAGVLAELDAAIEGCNLPYYFYKTYGREPLPADETQTDLGHNTHWGAYEGIAADITAWITGDAPTKERTYANPGAAGSVLTETGSAVIIEKHRADHCTPP